MRLLPAFVLSLALPAAHAADAPATVLEHTEQVTVDSGGRLKVARAWTVRVDDPDHPATVGLPRVWPRVDEWYDFRTNPRGAVRVLLTVDESSYDGGAMGADHPLAWCRARSFYTALGHTVESYAEPELRAHLTGGIRYAAGLA